MTPGGGALLEARGITKRFPGVTALDGVDFALRAGSIHALVGENGAGKSTLLRIITGALAPDEGELRLDAKLVRPRRPLDAEALGIRAVHQEIHLQPHLSLAENVTLGRAPRRFGFLDRGEARAVARRALARLGAEADVTRPLGACPIALRQLVAIARALEGEARVLVLDEPTASLEGPEVRRLFEAMRSLAARGIGILLVTHDLDEVFAACDRVTVLRNGRLVGESDPRSISREALVAQMLGVNLEAARALAASRARAATAAAREVALCASGLRRAGAVGPVDLEVRRGEVLGLAGLLGSGRTALLRLLAGADRADGGTIEVDGRPLRTGSVRRAIRAGIAFCPEDRRADAILPELSVRENLLLALQARRGWARRVRGAAAETFARKFILAVGLPEDAMDRPAGTLSGGNQQKLVLARWLATAPRVLLLDEPTRGIDVGAKGEIARKIAELCEGGLALVLVSSEVEEVVRESHRIVALANGKVVGELRGEEIDSQGLARLLASHSSGS